MWNRRDFAVLASAAVATFGLTLAMSHSRLANAVDPSAVATVNVKMPALNVGNARVTAARDEVDPQTINFTITNDGFVATTVEFLAQVMEVPSASELSRSIPMPQPVWGQEMSSTLKGGETKTIAVKLPASLVETASVEAAKAVNAKAANTKLVSVNALNAETANTNGAQSNVTRAARAMTPPMRNLTLSDKAQPQRAITAVNLANPVVVTQVAMANVKVAR